MHVQRAHKIPRFHPDRPGPTCRVVSGVPGGQTHGLGQAVDVERVVAPQPPQARHCRQRLVAAPRRRLLRLRIYIREECLHIRLLNTP